MHEVTIPFPDAQRVGKRPSFGIIFDVFDRLESQEILEMCYN